jgi:hypothetical protein
MMDDGENGLVGCAMPSHTLRAWPYDTCVCVPTASLCGGYRVPSCKVPQPWPMAPYRQSRDTQPTPRGVRTASKHSQVGKRRERGGGDVLESVAMRRAVDLSEKQGQEEHSSTAHSTDARSRTCIPVACGRRDPKSQATQVIAIRFRVLSTPHTCRLKLWYP